MRQQTRATLYALAAVLLWSTVASAFKITLRAVDPATLLLHAAWSSTAVLLLVLAAQRRLGRLRATGRELARSAALGLLSPFAYYLILFEAYDRLPGQEAQPLNYTWAIALALLSIPLLKQRIRPASLLALLVSFTGVVVIATRGDVTGLRFHDPVGVGLALGSSLVWALFWILNLRDGRDAVVKLAWCFLFGTAYVLAFAAATGRLAAPPEAGLAGAVYTGLFEMGLTFVLWLRALSLSRTTAQVSNLIFLSPFVSLVLLRFVAGETIHVSSVAGLALIVGGIVAQRRLEKSDLRS